MSAKYSKSEYIKRPLLIVSYLVQILRLRARQIAIFGLAFGEFLLDNSAELKDQTVRRMFWGRGSLYKTSFHLIIGLLTSVILLSGLSTRIQSASPSTGIEVGYGALGNQDLVAQGNSILSVLPVEPDQPNYAVTEYIVQPGENQDSIAAKFSVTKDTIRWANKDILSPYNNVAPAGATLHIPEMNGVLHEVKSGETLDSLLALTKGDRFTVIELNRLVPPNYSLAAGQMIFVPDGQLPPPGPYIVARGKPDNSGYIGTGGTGAALGILPAGFFDDPLTHPSCAGYKWNRGISASHSGVDLAKSGGCVIRAAGAGRVKFAGILDKDAMYTVEIDHGGGIETHYYHGDGNIWVRVGEYVSKGQAIMYMGCTGKCFGTHLHLTLRYNNTNIDPQPYIPYRHP